MIMACDTKDNEETLQPEFEAELMANSDLFF